MLAYAHLLTPPQASPSASICLSFPTPLLSIAAFLVLRQYIREHEKHKEYVLKQQGCGRNRKIPVISPSVLGQECRALVDGGGAHAAATEWLERHVLGYQCGQYQLFWRFFCW